MRVGQVDPARPRVVGVDGQADQALLVVAEHVDPADRRRPPSSPVVHLDGAAAFGEEDAVVIEQVQFHRLGEVFVEHDLREALLVRPHAGPVVVERRAVAEGVPQAARDVRQEQRLGVALRRMSQRRIEGPPPVDVVVPGDRTRLGRGVLIGALIARLVDVQQDVQVGGEVPEVVPLVGARPGVGQHRGRRMGRVADEERAGAHVRVARMAHEVAADEAAVPGPVVLRVGRRVDADKPAARLDVAHEGDLLRVVQHVARGVEEDDGPVGGQRVVVEHGRVLRRPHLKALRLPHAPHRLHARLDRRVAPPQRLAEHQHARQRRVAADGQAHESREGDEQRDRPPPGDEATSRAAFLTPQLHDTPWL